MHQMLFLFSLITIASGQGTTSSDFSTIPPVTSSSATPPSTTFTFSSPPTTTFSSTIFIPSTTVPSFITSSTVAPPTFVETSSSAFQPSFTSFTIDPIISFIQPIVTSFTSFRSSLSTSTSTASTTLSTPTSSATNDSINDSNPSQRVIILSSCIISIVLICCIALGIFVYKKRFKERQSLVDFKLSSSSHGQMRGMTGPNFTSKIDHVPSNETLNAETDGSVQPIPNNGAWSTRFSSFFPFFHSPQKSQENDIPTIVRVENHGAYEGAPDGSVATHGMANVDLYNGFDPYYVPVGAVVPNMYEVVLEPLAPNNPTFAELASQFSFWNTSLVSIHSIIVPNSLLVAFQAREQELSEWGSSFLFHHTSKTCDIGMNSKTTPCSEETCGVCRILRNGFDLQNTVTRGAGSGKLGTGLYFSMTARSPQHMENPGLVTPPRSSMIRTLSSLDPNPQTNGNVPQMIKSVLVCEVLLGNAFSPTSETLDEMNESGTIPPFFDSIWGKPDQIEGLNADEFVVNRNDQALAVYLCNYYE